MSIPKHVAIIMDGNRRWAEEKSLPVREGHKKGKETLEKVLNAALELGIKYTTVWALSLDNFAKRSKEEIDELMEIFKEGFLRLSEKDQIYEKEVRVNAFGRWKEMLPPSVKNAIEKVIDKTKGYSNHFLNFMISYSGKDEMIQAIQKIREKDGNPGDVEVTPDLVKENLFTSDLPPVDLMIRTGGEPHNSTGFMMWDVANSQYYFSDKYWPDFGGEDFKKAIQDFRHRERRFGE